MTRLASKCSKCLKKRYETQLPITSFVLNSHFSTIDVFLLEVITPIMHQPGKQLILFFINNWEIKKQYAIANPELNLKLLFISFLLINIVSKVKLSQRLFSKKNMTCPVSKQQLSDYTDLTLNHTLRRLIQAWCTFERL
jgi:hypothetical protein